MITAKELPIPFTDLAHVVRSPLAIMKTQLALSRGNPNYDELHTVFNSQINLIASIMDDVTFMQAHQTGQVTNGKDVVDVNLLAYEAWDIFASRHKDRTCRIKVFSQTRLELRADSSHIITMFVRMFEAATLDGATSLELNISSTTISLIDNGLGTNGSSYTNGVGTPKYSRRSSIGLEVVRIISGLHGYSMSICSSADGSCIELKNHAIL